MESFQDIRHTQEVLQLLRESASGYGAAAAQATDPLFRDVFTQRARERTQLVARLECHIASLGGEALDSLPTHGAERNFLHLKEAVTLGDDAVVREVKIGEDRIKEVFAATLAATTLSTTTRFVLSLVYGSAWLGQEDEPEADTARTHEVRMERPRAM